MTLHQSLHASVGILVVAALALATGSSGAVPAPAASSAAPPTPPAPITWTQNLISWPGGDWNGAVQAAAAHVEGGYTDWRLPIVTELQASLQNGTYGPVDPFAHFRNWSSRTQGNWAYAVVVVCDMNGNVIPSQSGQSQRLLKGSNLRGAKFVRP